jgi:hypothetical protein
LAGVIDGEVTFPVNLLLFTTLKPATSIMRASVARMTVSVTIAPMTPATAFEIPPEEDEEAVAKADVPVEVEAVVEAQTPVEFPHLLHQSA